MTNRTGTVSNGIGLDLERLARLRAAAEATRGQRAPRRGGATAAPVDARPVGARGVLETIPQAVVRVAARRAGRVGDSVRWPQAECLADMRFAGQMLAKLKAMPEMRDEKVEAARARIVIHGYDSPTVMNALLEKLAEDENG